MPSHQPVRTLTWSDGAWTNEPASVKHHPLGITVEAADHSDAWADPNTGESVVSANALVAPFPPDTAMEVAFVADMTEQYDQAGMFILADDQNWAKVGAELTAGQVQLCSTVTRGRSDRAESYSQDWNGRAIRMRISRNENVVTFWASLDADPFQLTRMFHIDRSVPLRAGPYLASPLRKGLSITFTDWVVTKPDDVNR